MATGAPTIPAIEGASDGVDKESSNKPVVAEDNLPLKGTNPAVGGKSSKKDAKEGKKSGPTSNNGSMMDIGVWNPDAVKSNPNSGINGIYIP